MDTIFGLFQTENTLRFWVQFQDGQGKKTQCAIRERTRRMCRFITTGHLHRQQFASLIAIDADFVNIAYQL